MAAVKFFAEIHGYNVQFSNFHRLYLLFRGIKRSHGTKYKKPKRTPITPKLLHIIKFNLFNSSIIYEDKLMLWAAMLTAFFGFLRVSEYTSLLSKSFDPESTLLIYDVSIKTEGGIRRVEINIKKSKTDPFRQGTVIHLSPNGSQICPIQALCSYLHHHPTKQGPLFTFSNGKFLTRRNICTSVKNFLPSVNNISTHSFRIGAATTAAAAGHPRWLIQSLGRWTSDCFREYIRIPNGTFDMVSKSLISMPEGMSTYDPDNV
jgi:hypothetical protein